MREVCINKKLTSFKYLDFKDLIEANNITTFHKHKQIHKRISYKFWKKIVETMMNLALIEQISLCEQIWNQMDDRHCFHSLTQSRFDLESLALCLKESNECRGEK